MTTVKNKENGKLQERSAKLLTKTNLQNNSSPLSRKPEVQGNMNQCI
jgi:hypothetical protein